MSLHTQSEGYVGTGGPTITMAAVEAESLSGQQPKHPAPRLRSVGHGTKILYHVVAMLVLLGGTLGGLAMHFGWIGPWFGGDSSHSPAGGAMFTPRPGATSRPATPLVQGTFQRPGQQLWGRASDGPVWGGEANSATAFAMAGRTGPITGGQGFFDALPGPMRANAAFQVSASISRFNNGYDNLGAVLRWTDNDDYYKASLSGTQLVPTRRVAGKSTMLGLASFPAQGATTYTLRFLASGTQLRVRAWVTGW